jgi:hypothetical protein
MPRVAVFCLKKNTGLLMRIPSVSLIAKDQLPAVVPAGVTAFNSNDASGAAGLAADVGAIASVGAHALPVLTGAYTRDTAEIFDHFTLDEEGVTEQARTVLEDLPVQAFKVGFVGSPENIGVVAAIAADYSDVPRVAYMPDLSWWGEVQIERYLEAFKELIGPQTTVLVGNHSTLWRWLLPEWGTQPPPSGQPGWWFSTGHGACRAGSAGLGGSSRRSRLSDPSNQFFLLPFFN